MAGMVVTANYSDGSTQTVTGYTTSGFSSTAAGQKTVTVTYQSKTATFTVTINAATLTGIAITTQPTKIVYNIGDTLNMAGMVVTATYSDGSTQTVTTYTTSGFSSTTGGQKTVTVTYQSKTATFIVTVNAATLTGIAVTTQPTKTVYNIGDTLNTAGMVVTATYSDGTTAAVTGYTTSGFSSTTAGQKTVIVTYQSKTATFTVTVNIDPSNITSITDLETWLSAQPGNTAANAYAVKLNVSSLGGNAYTDGSVGAVLKADNTKYISLDLSGSAITSIEDSAFISCTSLTSVTLPNSVNSIGDSAFNGCTSLASITLPNNLTSIGISAFNRCTNLTSINIPNTVTSIGGSAFQSCAGLTSINIPSSVTSIESSAFNRCTGLTSVTIPGSVKSIGDWGFGNNTNLTSVTFEGTIPVADFGSMGSFFGDLRDKFYATNSTNGTPGTYTTTSPVSASSVWALQK